MATEPPRSPRRSRRRARRRRQGASGPRSPAGQRRLLYGEGDTLLYGKRSIRVIPVNGVLHFALPDILDALGFRKDAASVLRRPSFPLYGKAVCDEEEDPEVPGQPEEVVVLSPVGLLYLAHLTDAMHCERLVAWARREARSRCPSPPPGDRALTLTVQPDGLLPPYPTRYSGWRSEWISLKQANPGNDWAGRHRAAA